MLRDDATPSGADGGGAGGGAGTAGTGGGAGSAGAAADAGTGGSGTGDAAGGSGGAVSDGGIDATDANSTDGPSEVGDATIGDAGTFITASSGTWVIYPDPYGDGGAANPIASTVMGKAEAYALPGGKMRVTLSVTGLPPNRPCGSHIHKLACDNNKAGGHYQNIAFPADGGIPSDPTFANGANEVWLDFTTDANGAGHAETTVDWVPRAGEANAVMIHDMKTGDGGLAGAKLACSNMPF